MQNKRLMMQRILEAVMASGVCLAENLADDAALAAYVIPAGAKIGDYVYVMSDASNAGRRGVYVLTRNNSGVLVFSKATFPVYFQPPGNDKIKPPCIIYHLSDIEVLRANNSLYKVDTAYAVTLVDPNPDSPFVEKLLAAPCYVAFDRSYISDALNHWVFTLYY